MTTCAAQTDCHAPAFLSGKKETRIAYFDCFAGASGDMILGALLDAGLAIEELKSEVAKLGLGGYTLGVKKVIKKGLSGSQALVTIEEDAHGPGRHHHHEKEPHEGGPGKSCHTPRRHLADIRKIIEDSTLSAGVKKRSLSVFTRLAEAEAKVHGVPVASVHFHEVGAVDALVDIVGGVAGLELLGVDVVYCSPLHVGGGTVACAHGILPVPAPATLELVRGLPIYADEVQGEMLTPTGAALLTTLSKRFGPLPAMVVEKVGYGAGQRETTIANLLRVTIGKAVQL